MTRHATDHWHDLVTVALLGTDRREPPAPPAGPLADVVDDTVAADARRRGCSPPSRPVSPPAGPACSRCRRRHRSRRPPPTTARSCRPRRPGGGGAASRPGRCWRTSGSPSRNGAAGGSRLTCWWVCSAVTATTPCAAARVLRMGGPVAAWLLELQPELRSSAARREPPGIDDPLPGLAVPPELVDLLDAGPAVVVPAVLGGLRTGAYDHTHRAVLVNFVARMRTDGLAPAGRRARLAGRPAEHRGRPVPLARRPGVDPGPHAGGADRVDG